VRRSWCSGTGAAPLGAAEQAFADLFSITDVDTLIITYGYGPPRFDC
jgi:hypothetical protein